MNDIRDIVETLENKKAEAMVKSETLEETASLLQQATSEVETLQQRIDSGVSELDEMIATLNGLTGTMNQLEEDIAEADNCETAYDAVSHFV